MCNNQQILIVTGLSGAGKTSVMRGLEDLGFYCVDNLPIPLINTFLDLACKANTGPIKVALGIDARGERFLPNFINEIEKLKRMLGESLKIIFLNANTQTLLKRFQETRRKHPLATKIDLATAIEKEKKLLEPIMTKSDMLLDTDILNIHDLRHWVQQTFAGPQGRKLVVSLVSFGFKYGVPAESNLVFDLRFLPNPYFIPELKSLDGRDVKIQNFLFSNTQVTKYWDHLQIFIKYTLQKYYEEGRFSVTISIGCTGGKHRSVSFVEKLGHELWEHTTFLTVHRDVEKE